MPSIRTTPRPSSTSTCAPKTPRSVTNEMNYPTANKASVAQIKPEIAGNKTIFVGGGLLQQDDSAEQLHQRSPRSHGQRLQQLQKRQVTFFLNESGLLQPRV